MNALERKAVVKAYEDAVAGDPTYPFAKEFLGSRATVTVSEVAARFGSLDANRVRHFLLAAGYEPSASDPDTYERRPWWVYPWPSPGTRLASSRRRDRGAVNAVGSGAPETSANLEVFA